MAKRQLTIQEKLDEWDKIIQSPVWNDYILRFNKIYSNGANVFHTTEGDLTLILGKDGRTKTIKYPERMARLQGKMAGIKQSRGLHDEIIEELKKERDSE